MQLFFSGRAISEQQLSVLRAMTPTAGTFGSFLWIRAAKTTRIFACMAPAWPKCFLFHDFLRDFMKGWHYFEQNCAGLYATPRPVKLSKLKLLSNPHKAASGFLFLFHANCAILQTFYWLDLGKIMTRAIAFDRGINVTCAVTVSVTVRRNTRSRLKR